MQNEEYKHLRRNIAITLSEGSLFGFGSGIASFATVIPLFVAQMTDSAILIGLITAVHITGWQIPQLLMARSVSRLKRYKPMVMAMTIHERLPFLGLALIAFFYQQLGPLPGLVLTFAMLIWQGLGAGFTANAWQNMIGKVIPPEKLATVFGLQSSAFNLLSAVRELGIQYRPIEDALGDAIASYLQKPEDQEAPIVSSLRDRHAGSLAALGIGDKEMKHQDR